MVDHRARRAVGISASRGRGGFTLLEVMIVIVIILAITALVGVNLMSGRERAMENLTKTQLERFDEAIKQFHLEFNRYPTEDEGLEVLWSNETLDPDADEAKWRPFLDEALPQDEWNNEWVYTTETEDEGRPYNIWSIGPDGEEDSDDDIKLFDEDAGEFGGEGFAPPPPPSGG